MRVHTMLYLFFYIALLPFARGWGVQAKRPSLFARKTLLSQSAASSVLEAPKTAAPDASPLPKEAVVVGSGPIGLATALMLAQQGVPLVRVFDQLPRPPKPDDQSFWGTFRSERSYNIGLSGRAQKTLGELGVMERVGKYVAPLYGAAFWTPSTPSDQPAVEIVTGRKYKTLCIERDRLVGSLLEEIEEKYAGRIQVQFDTKCTAVAWQQLAQSQETCELALQSPSQTFIVNASLVIGADGSNSALRDAMGYMDPAFQTTSYEDSNVYVYRTLPVTFNQTLFKDACPSDQHMSVSVRLKEGLLLEALPTKEGVHLAVLLYQPNHPLINAMKTVEDAQRLFDTHFPMTKGGVSPAGFEKLVFSRESRFPRFQFVYPKLHFSRSVCLLGDSIHSVKPYFGLGVNSGFEDVSVLKQCLSRNGNNVPQALQAFSKERAEEAKALVTVSQRMDRGFAYFVLPLIMDSIFNRLFPGLFSKSMTRCLQDESLSFTQAIRRKRRDRALQISMLVLLSVGLVGGLAQLLGRLSLWLVRWRAVAMGRIFG